MHKLYNSWRGMKERCFNKKRKTYSHYGGKGINVCEEWMQSSKFIDWALNNGYEYGLTLDRVDSNKDYCPSNCRWVTRSVNSRARGKFNEKQVIEIRKLLNNGYGLSEISRIFNTSPQVIFGIRERKVYRYVE